MKRTTYQVPELRDENDNIIQQGAFGKNTALANSTNDGWIDYVANDLMYLYNNTMGGTGGEINTETITGKTGTITNLTATTVKADTLTADALNGPLTGNVTGTADKAVADGDGNNIVNTYVTKSSLASSVTTGTGKVTTLTATDSTLTNLTVTGETTVPTANAGNSSKAIANTEFVAKSLASLPTTDKVNALIKQAITDLLNSGDVAVNGTQTKIVSDNQISNYSQWNEFTYTAKESGWYSVHCTQAKNGTSSAYICTGYYGNYNKTSRVNGNGARDLSPGPIWVKAGETISYGCIYFGECILQATTREA